MPGHVTKRGKDSWSVVVDYGRDPQTGKRRQMWRSVKGTKKDAETLLVQLLHQRDTGLDQPVAKLTVAKYLEQWLVSVKANAAPKTYRTTADIVDRHVVPVIGSHQLAKLRPAHIQTYLADRQTRGRLNGKGGLSARSVQRHYQVIHAALRRAVKLELLPRNPADSVEPPTAERKPFRGLSPDEVGTVFAAADATPYGPLVRLAVLTGMRQGELLGLAWRDVDLDAGLLSVQRSRGYVAGTGTYDREPKTRNSRRAVALSPDTVQLLRQHRVKQLEAKLQAGEAWQDSGYVFTHALGGPLDPSNVRRAWRSIVKRAGIGHVRFHDLRHTHASLMLRQGTHLKVVSERLGHSGIGITADTYSHVLPGLQAAAAAQFDAVLLDRSGDAAAV